MSVLSICLRYQKSWISYTVLKSAYIELVIISSLGSHHDLYRLQMQTGVHVIAHCAVNDLLLKVNDPDDPSKKSPMALSKSSAENLMYLSGCLPVSKKLPYRPTNARYAGSNLSAMEMRSSSRSCGSNTTHVDCAL